MRQRFAAAIFPIARTIRGAALPQGRLRSTRSWAESNWRRISPCRKQLQVSYCYGFPAEIGGGPYDRTPNLPTLDPSQFNYVAVVGSSAAPTLEEAIADWNLLPAGSRD